MLWSCQEYSKTWESRVPPSCMSVMWKQVPTICMWYELQVDMIIVWYWYSILTHKSKAVEANQRQWRLIDACDQVVFEETTSTDRDPSSSRVPFRGACNTCKERPMSWGSIEWGAWSQNCCICVQRRDCSLSVDTRYISITIRFHSYLTSWLATGNMWQSAPGVHGGHRSGRQARFNESSIICRYRIETSRFETLEYLRSQRARHAVSALRDDFQHKL